MLNRIREFSYKQPAATAVIAFLLIGRRVLPNLSDVEQASAVRAASGRRARHSEPQHRGHRPGVCPPRRHRQRQACRCRPGSAGPTSAGGRRPPGSSAANAAPPAPSAGAGGRPGGSVRGARGLRLRRSGPTPSRPAAGGPRSGARAPARAAAAAGPRRGTRDVLAHRIGAAGAAVPSDGVIGGPTAVAILVDKDGSHIVTSGDVLAPGVRVSESTRCTAWCS